jgi:FAD/FMN-containing dehydrogenase
LDQIQHKRFLEYRDRHVYFGALVQLKDEGKIRHIGLSEVDVPTLEAAAKLVDVVSVQNGRYVQGGGCTTVGVAGLVQSGGFGSFSKHYGTAAAGLLEAEVVTADGKVCVANACTNADLFWALKGGGGGTFGELRRREHV